VRERSSSNASNCFRRDTSYAIRLQWHITDLFPLLIIRKHTRSATAHFPGRCHRVGVIVCNALKITATDSVRPVLYRCAACQNITSSFRELFVGLNPYNVVAPCKGPIDPAGGCLTQSATMFSALSTGRSANIYTLQNCSSENTHVVCVC
jgi:hypothetical protein